MLLYPCYAAIQLRSSNCKHGPAPAAQRAQPRVPSCLLQARPAHLRVSNAAACISLPALSFRHSSPVDVLTALRYRMQGAMGACRPGGRASGACMHNDAHARDSHCLAAMGAHAAGAATGAQMVQLRPGYTRLCAEGLRSPPCMRTFLLASKFAEGCRAHGKAYAPRCQGAWVTGVHALEASIQARLVDRRGVVKDVSELGRLHLLGQDCRVRGAHVHPRDLRT